MTQTRAPTTHPGAMDHATARRLASINRRFYARHAASFSHSRQRPWEGWERLLEHLPKTGERPLEVLDAGCGNARFARFLASRHDGAVVYLGVDASSELLDAARRDAAELPPRVRVECRELELMGEDLGRELGRRRFDLVALFGVLHHLPGASKRREIVRHAGELLRSGGVVAATLWRFDQEPRFASKRLGWEEYNRHAQEPIDVARLEPGDHLLTWSGDRSTPRYCHLVDEEEERALVAASGLELVARYAADGPNGDDNVYLVLGKDPCVESR